MTILVFLSFFAGLIFYFHSVNERSLSIGGYFFGLFCGVIALIILKFISFDNMAISSQFWVHSLRFFLYYFLIPAVISFPIFFLISFSISEETIMASPACLLGVFTIMFLMTMFHFRSIPNTNMFVLFTMLYIGSIFLFYAFLKLCFAVLSFMPPIGSFFIAFLVFLMISFLASTSLSIWYCSVSQMTSLLIAVCLLGVGVFFTLIMTKIKN